MLVELRVRGLGVIEDQRIVLGPGLTALTGETGAGKTLLVDAIALLCGAPAEPAMVAAGSAEALVEGRFEIDGWPAPLGEGPGADDGELILSRVVPAGGRSRCYLNGRMVPVAQLAEIGRALVDIHGQHAHQSLLSPAAQRNALDRAGGVDVSPVEAARRRVRELTAARRTLGGDARERARRLDLLTYQLAEIDRADLDAPDEDDRLQQEQDLLADAGGLAEAAGAAWQALAADGGLVERAGEVVALTGHRRALEGIHSRLIGVQEELADVAADARRLAESVEDDPERLAAVGERRRVLAELRRKYGGTLAEVIAFREQLRREVDELRDHDRRAAQVETELAEAEDDLARALDDLRQVRAEAARRMAEAVEEELRQLAMPRARFAIDVDPDPSAESVTWLLAANPGQALLPLSKVASGGELARTMLATRLVSGRAERARRPGPERSAPPLTLIFDEVDAGIGGEAATAVGRALATLGRDHQVLVVTHLAQVAACAAEQVAVGKEVVTGVAGEERTVATAHPLERAERVVELARMLSGRPDSEAARRHAEELLAPPPAGGRRRRASPRSGPAQE